MVVFTLLLNKVNVFANFMFNNLDRDHGSERVKEVSYGGLVVTERAAYRSVLRSNF